MSKVFLPACFVEKRNANGTARSPTSPAPACLTANPSGPEDRRMHLTTRQMMARFPRGTRVEWLFRGKPRKGAVQNWNSMEQTLVVEDSEKPQPGYLCWVKISTLTGAARPAKRKG